MEPEPRRVPSLFLIPLVLCFVGLFLFVALLQRHRDLAVLSILVLALAGGTRLWTRWSLSGLRCLPLVDRRKLFPGEELSLNVFAENGKFLPVWLRVEVPVRGQFRSSSDGACLAEESSLLWYQRVEFRWKLTAERRGVHLVGPVRVVSGDLFGFFPKERRLEEAFEIVVYPCLVPLKPFSVPRRDFFGIPGARSPVQDPVYILGTRDYQHGRPARHIHWKASARHGRLQEKVFEPTEHEKIVLVVDVGQFAQQGAEQEFEDTLETVASLSLVLNRQGCSVGLVTNCVMAGEGVPVLPPARNPQQLPAILEALARLRMEAREDLIAVMRSNLELLWGLSALCFTLEEDETARTVREYFRQRRTPVVLFACRDEGPLGGEGTWAGSGIHYLDELRVEERVTGQGSRE